MHRPPRPHPKLPLTDVTRLTPRRGGRRSGRGAPRSSGAAVVSTYTLRRVPAWWSRLGSNQRPSACEADALPLSHGTGAERRTTSKSSTRRALQNVTCGSECRAITWTRPVPRDLCGPAYVDYRRPSHRATISSVARGCSAVGSASPCQGEGRGFESRHPLEGASGINPSGGVAEW